MQKLDLWKYNGVICRAEQTDVEVVLSKVVKIGNQYNTEKVETIPREIFWEMVDDKEITTYNGEMKVYKKWK